VNKGNVEVHIFYSYQTDLVIFSILKLWNVKNDMQRVPLVLSFQGHENICSFISKLQFIVLNFEIGSFFFL